MQDNTDKSGCRNDIMLLYHLTWFLDFWRKKAISLSSTFIKCQTSVTKSVMQEPFLLFLVSFLYLQHERVWKRYADSFHMTGQTTHLVIKCTMKIIWWICQKYWNLLESRWNSLENHWKQKPTMLQIPQTNRCSERAITLMQKLCAACKKQRQIAT